MQPHRSNAAARWCCRRFDSGTHAWCGHATVMVLVPSASGPRVSGCPRAPLNFRPYPTAIPRIFSTLRWAVLQRASDVLE